jgi:hypothetical protein
MTLRGSCHCGATRFEVDAPPTSVTACTCSYCSKVGCLWAYYPPEHFRLLTPERDRALYLWRSKTIEHYFCATCGCSTYGVSPEWVDMKPDPVKRRVGVNARLFDDFELAAVPLRTIDGKNLW